jgi:hypothetical protein
LKQKFNKEYRSRLKGQYQAKQVLYTLFDIIRKFTEISKLSNGTGNRYQIKYAHCPSLSLYCNWMVPDLAGIQGCFSIMAQEWSQIQNQTNLNK